MKLAPNKTPIMTIVNGDSNVITKYIVDKAIVNLSRFLISLSNALNTVKFSSLGWYIYHVYYGLFSWGYGAIYIAEVYLSISW